jgi:hypothetical protein
MADGTGGATVELKLSVNAGADLTLADADSDKTLVVL